MNHSDWTFFELAHWHGYSWDELADTSYDQRLALIEDLDVLEVSQQTLEVIDETYSN